MKIEKSVYFSSVLLLCDGDLDDRGDDFPDRFN